MTWWRRFAGDQRGNMAVLFAAGLALSAVVSAVAVDAAALYHERRQLQRGVDLAAISAARDPAQAASIARDVLVEAGVIDPDETLAKLTAPNGALKVSIGRYNPDPSIAPGQRFASGVTPVNAVSVRLQRPGTLYFAQNWSQQPVIGADALAAVTPQVAFSIGSRLASLEGGIANAVLHQLLGSNVALTLVDYNGLANAQVDLFGFLDALATELGISVGTYDDVLAASADHGQIAAALAAVLTGADKAAAQTIARAAGDNGSVLIGKLFGLGELGAINLGTAGTQGLFAAVSALEVLTVSAALSDGKHQIALDLDADVPGLVGIEASLAVGEPPQGVSWFAIGPTQTVVRTAQVRLRLVVKLLGGTALLGAPVRLPLYLEVAHSEAIVGAAACPTGTNTSGSATILTRPGVLRLMVGEVNATSFGDFNTTPSVGLAKLVEVKLLGLTVLQVMASSVVEIAQTSPVPLSFSPSEIAAGTIKTAKTATVATSLVGSLLGNLDLRVPVLGLGLSLKGVGNVLAAVLNPVAPTLDLVIARLLETLGVAVGEADVRVYGVRCTHPVLVG